MPTAGTKRRDRGFLLIIVAGILLVMCLFAGLAVDVGRVFVVRGELQNAADASALAGAGSIASTGSASSPNWSDYTASIDCLKRNKAYGELLRTGEVGYGWWNFASNTWATGSPVSGGVIPLQTVPGYCSNNPNAVCTADAACGAGVCIFQNVAAAVRTTITKSAGVNGGAVPTFFSRLLGVEEFQVGTTSTPSTAVAGAPSSVPNGVFPWAITKDTADFWVSRPGVAATLTVLGSSSDPYRGHWTSFDRSNDVEVVDNQISTSKSTLRVGDTVHIVAGTKAYLFPLVKLDGDVLLAVVDPSMFAYNRDATIFGFIGFHITNADSPSTCLQGYFTTYTAPANSRPGGPTYGVRTHPILVQ